jgi:hypothetical protein
MISGCLPSTTLDFERSNRSTQSSINNRKTVVGGTGGGEDIADLMDEIPDMM